MLAVVKLRSRLDDQMPRSQLRPHQVWLIGVPLNLLLSVPLSFPLGFVLVAGHVIAVELGVTKVDPMLVDDGVEIVIVIGLVFLVLFALLVYGLNALFALRAPNLNRKVYWLGVTLLILIPGIIQAVGWDFAG
ncbi:hypothetical protein [Amycolatopsis magusensis]|uniref:hypothetical protein n=1 Tax=Amycolatopsis magusensis TaxID=882444 RepID=UPI003C2ADC0A